MWLHRWIEKINLAKNNNEHINNNAISASDDEIIKFAHILLLASESVAREWRKYFFIPGNSIPYEI